MLTLDPDRLSRLSVPLSTGWLLGECMQALGKQELWVRQKPEVLEALRERAIIQSAESSNRIEGVTVDSQRLRPLVIGHARPLDRSEEEIAGYRKALNWIYSRKQPISFSPSLFQKLHSMAQGGVIGDAGKWKARDNEIIEIQSNGIRRVLFVPTPANETPVTIARLCDNFNSAYEQDAAPPLLLAASLVFDFLCIHPFRDGNGRASRLATALVLQNLGFQVCRYVSLERLVEDSKEEYYQVLRQCSQGWHDGTNELMPWWNYFLGVLRRACAEMEENVKLGSHRSAKSDMVRAAVMDQFEPFSLGELMPQIPSIGKPLIRKVLSAMREEGIVTLSGTGRTARWHVRR